MLMIRFQRTGRTNDPSFRIVLLEKERAAKDGNITEQLGTYNPRSKALTLDGEKVKYWISKGAQPTDSIRNLLISQKIIEGKKVNVLPKKTPIIKEVPVVAAAPVAAAAPAESVAPVAAEAVVEAPAEAPTEAEVVEEALPAEAAAEVVEEAPVEAAVETPAE